MSENSLVLIGHVFYKWVIHDESSENIAKISTIFIKKEYF